MLQQAMGGMLHIPQWFVWRLTWDAAENKYDKVPCYPDGSPYRMNAQDPNNWMTYDQACNSLAWHRSRSDGFAYTLGFMLTADTGYWFLDIDKCLVNDQLAPHADILCKSFPGAAWEWSSSGTGLHIFGRGVIPPHRMKDIHKLKIEFYSDKRGIAFGLTGDMYGNADSDHTGAVAWLVENYFPPQAMAGEVLDSQFDRPDPAWNGERDDDKLIEQMRRKRRLSAAEVFGGIPDERASFADLFDNNPDVMDRVYGNDESGAEFALIGMLSFWTGRDARRIEAIMRRSKLYRDKWETNRGSETFIRYSILRACREHYGEKRGVYGQQRGKSQSVEIESAIGSSAGFSTGLSPNDEPTKWEASREWIAKFNSAGSGEELEELARVAQADPRITQDLAYTLGRVIHERFELLQIDKPLPWCRSLVMPVKVTDGFNAVYALTEMGNADRMLARFGQELIYVLQMEKWFRWNGVRWQYCYPDEMRNLADRVIRDLSKEMDGMDSSMQQAFYKFALESQKTSMVSAMIKHAQANSMVARHAKWLDADKNIIGVTNGAVDLVTGILLSPDLNRYITMSCNTHYDPAADCPWFKQTVLDCFYGDVEMAQFFKRLMGYAQQVNIRSERTFTGLVIQNIQDFKQLKRCSRLEIGTVISDHI